jgi:hypothetical protein
MLYDASEQKLLDGIWIFVTEKISTPHFSVATIADQMKQLQH